MKNKINPIHTDNTNFYPFLKSPRCGAKTRKATTCQAPAVRNKKRCRMHGGARGSGAPVGSQNALKHGFCTEEVKQLKKEIKLLYKELF
ncbi:HGGxSTG domain-containing protein [Legionella pneumophila subsp. fraseri]|nr:HGGxSTG domain-containing protein [Legionella pneumophila]MDW8880641.1 HGGxSTG domain-containing protein [Legionella pneumophila subsp. fraseri]MDW8962257.1 HGGxSTG domain-containing protein [Legionella pneumophila subsp. fraseri]MDW9034749.1 HGGxSTG domain-containing protein [Legionella pneumophila subsp. fraseri]MDW9037575.1 HGGxSTG domain-containing protein [Legionella pneumophila subsp. fraseri]MDW9040870.1 HGGxSTG domain-containing protein [Legionella pneumophila subsp. fraseri]